MKRKKRKGDGEIREKERRKNLVILMPWYPLPLGGKEIFFLLFLSSILCQMRKDINSIERGWVTFLPNALLTKILDVTILPSSFLIYPRKLVRHTYATQNNMSSGTSYLLPSPK